MSMVIAVNLESLHRRLISGQRRGPVDVVGRLTLAAAGQVYGLGVRMRNRQFDLGRREIRRLPRPVVSIGNLVVGGSGKTPMVAWLAEQLQAHGFRPAILMRGYRAVDGKNDEHRLLESLLGDDVPIMANPDRHTGGLAVLESQNVDVFLLDDGFQHRRLHRDVDLALLDATRPFGYDHLLPRGLLREPIENIERADAVLITRAEQVSAETISSIQDRIRRITDAPMHQVRFEAGPRLDGRDVAMFCALGNPEAFAATVLSLGGEIRRRIAFADHYHFTDGDIASAERVAAIIGGPIVTTAKDWVKLQGRTSPTVEWTVVKQQPAIDDAHGLIKGILSKIRSRG